MNTTSYPYLSNVEIILNQPIKVLIAGNWPTPSWKITDIQKKIDDNNHIITISIIGESGKGLALQVLKPFSEAVELSTAVDKNWKIIVKGRAGDIIKQI